MGKNKKTLLIVFIFFCFIVAILPCGKAGNPQELNTSSYVMPGNLQPYNGTNFWYEHPIHSTELFKVTSLRANLLQDGGILLTWSSPSFDTNNSFEDGARANQQDVKKFKIYRNDGRNWALLGTVTKDATSFIDANPPSGQIKYRVATVYNRGYGLLLCVWNASEQNGVVRISNFVGCRRYNTTWWDWYGGGPLKNNQVSDKFYTVFTGYVNFSQLSMNQSNIYNMRCLSDDGCRIYLGSTTPKLNRWACKKGGSIVSYTFSKNVDWLVVWHVDCRKYAELKWSPNCSFLYYQDYRFYDCIIPPNYFFMIDKEDKETYVEITVNRGVGESGGNNRAPTYENPSTNSTRAGEFIKHSLFWRDDSGLSHAIFSFDNCTGRMTNITTIRISGTNNWSNFSVKVNSTVGCTIRWKVYANDTNNQFNASETYTYNTIGSFSDRCDAAIIDGTFYYCHNSSDNVCPEHFSDVNGNSPICSRNPSSICYDPDCVGVVGCIIKTANINPYCKNNACGSSRDDKIFLNSTFSCLAGINITKLEFIANSSDNQCVYRMEIECNSNTNCSGNFSIEAVPENCVNKTVVAKGVAVYRNDSKMASNFSSSGYGRFKFADRDIGIFLKNVLLVGVPDYAPQNYIFNVTAYANFSNSTDYWLENITFAKTTYYNSSNKSVVFNTRNGFGWPEFKTDNVGNANVSVLYPYNNIANKSDSKNMTVFAPVVTCQIHEAEIFPYCGNDGCKIGERVELRVNISTSCPTIDAILIEGLNETCEVEMMTTNVECEELQLKRYCKGNWTIGNVKEECKGKTIRGKYVTIFSQEQPVAFLDDPSKIHGFFIFEMMEIIGLKAIIVSPSDGSVFNIRDTIWLNESSKGNINNWSWYYKNITGSWILHRSFSKGQNPNTTFSLPQGAAPGAYYINLTVENETEKDSTYVRIHFCAEGWPCAIISRPYESEIVIPDRTLGTLIPGIAFFNGSLSFDTNADPSNNFNLTWFFDITNRTKKVTGFYNLTNVTYYIYWPASKYAGSSITAELNASDGQNSTIDRVTFKLAYCQQGNDKFFAGSCTHSSGDSRNRYCNESDCNNEGECRLVRDCRKCYYCQQGQQCNYASGTCEDLPPGMGCSNRGVTPPSKCFNASARGCFINKTDGSWACADCIINGVKQIRACSDYKNSSSCINDTYACNVGSQGSGGIGTEDCGQIVTISGQQYLVANCGCSWNGTACNLNKTYMPQSGSGPGPGQGTQCSYSISYSGCGIQEGGCSVGGRPGRWVNLTLVSGPPAECQPSSTCQPCGVAFARLPFFETWHMLIAFLLIALLYFFIEKRKNEK